jgi:hypothetical protein
VWVKPLGEGANAAGKERLDLTIGGSHEIELPVGFEPRRDKLVLAMAGRVIPEVTDEGKFKVTGRTEGVCDLAIVYKSKPTVYRIVVGPAAK